jgi:hypothetical protein
MYEPPYHLQLLSFIFDECNESSLNNNSDPDINLEKIVNHWEGLDFISFCTAFRIRGNHIEKKFGGSNESTSTELCEQSQSEIEKLKSIFSRLQQYPDPERNLGKRPWEIIRSRMQRNNQQSGAILPEFLLLSPNENIKNNLADKKLGSIHYHPRVDIQKICLDIEEINQEFQSNDDRENLSWKFYAAYVCQIGDKIREIENAKAKKTALAIYITGTDQELIFHGEDYGIIIGVADEMLDNIDELSRCINGIIFTWKHNISLVYLSKIRDEIIYLKANQDIAHTIKNSIEVVKRKYVIPIFDKIINSSNYEYSERKSFSDEIEKYFNRLSSVADLAAFAQDIAESERNKKNVNDRYTEKYCLLSFVTETLSEFYRVNSLTEMRILESTWPRKGFMAAYLLNCVEDICRHGLEETVRINLFLESCKLIVSISNTCRENQSCGKIIYPYVIKDSHSAPDSSLNDKFYLQRKIGIRTYSTISKVSGEDVCETKIEFDLNLLDFSQSNRQIGYSKSV